MSGTIACVYDFVEITPDYAPHPVFGTGHHVSMLAPALASIGRRTAVVTRNAVGAAERETMAGVEVFRCAAEWDREHLRSGRAPVDLLARQIEFCGLMHNRFGAQLNSRVVHNHDDRTYPLAAALSRQWNCPLVTTLHVFEPLFEEFGGDVVRSRDVDNFVVRALEAASLSLADLVIAPSEFAAGLVSRAAPAAAPRTRVLPHPVDTDVQHRQDYAIREQPIVVFVGRVTVYKGFSSLIRALSIVEPGAELWIVGGGPDEDDAREQVRRLGVRCRWFGSQPRERVSELLSLADVAVVPSVIETYGMVLDEAMAAGLPVVCSDIPPFRERVTPGANGFLVPLSGPRGGAEPDHRALAAAITDLIADEALRTRLGRAARTTVLQRPGPVAYAKQLDDLVAGLFELRPAASPGSLDAN